MLTNLTTPVLSGSTTNTFHIKKKLRSNVWQKEMERNRWHSQAICCAENDQHYCFPDAGQQNQISAWASPSNCFFLDYLYILHLQGFLHSIRPLLELLDRRSSPPPTTSLISRSLCATQLVSVGCRTTRMRMHPVSIHHRSRDIPWMFTGESRFENMP